MTSAKAMEISVSANMGERCFNERHLFRIGNDSTDVIEFSADKNDFLSQITNALLDHDLADRRASTSVFLQVWTTDSAKWRNVQNPKSGGVLAVTHEIVGQHETAAQLFLWACHSVQMARDIDTMSDGLAREV
jgi:hypothetical protein